MTNEYPWVPDWVLTIWDSSKSSAVSGALEAALHLRDYSFHLRRAVDKVLKPQEASRHNGSRPCTTCMHGSLHVGSRALHSIDGYSTSSTLDCSSFFFSKTHNIYMHMFTRYDRPVQQITLRCT